MRETKFNITRSVVLKTKTIPVGEVDERTDRFVGDTDDLAEPQELPSEPRPSETFRRGLVVRPRHWLSPNFHHRMISIRIYFKVEQGQLIS